MVRGYLRLMMFALGMLVGLQVPGFVNQYKQRVDAHFREVSQNISAFQDTAGRYFGGDMDQLITYYARSGDKVFRDDAESVAAIYSRYQALRKEQDAMQAPWYRVVVHILLQYDSELFKEALHRYRYVVVLDPGAIAWGVFAGLGLAVSVELLALLVWASGRRARVKFRQRRSAATASHSG